FLAWSRHQKQVQRDADAKYSDQREANEGRPFEPIGRQFDDQHMQTAKQQSPTSMYSDQQGRRGLAEQLHGADGVLSDDRIRNTVIENHRRTTAAITATTNSVAAATAEFRRDAKENYPSLISTIKGNGERTDRLSANTKVIIDNTDTISRIGKKYSDLYRADQWQSQGDEPNYNELRGRTGENLNHTTVSLVTSSQSSAEFARNVRTIEANIVQMKERKKEMEQPQPKRDRGMNFGM
ncbi:mobilization protein, partial [Acinetobacter baumannii]